MLLKLVKSAMFAAAALASLATGAKAEVTELAIAKQYGMSFIPMMLMEKHQLIEKAAESRGLPKPTINWLTLAGPSMMNDGLLSGTLHYAAAGAPSLGLLWDRTGGKVKSLGMICEWDLFLNTRNPNVKTIADFTDKDRIAVSSVKVSLMAIRLQMEAEKLFGEGNHEKLDHLTVTLAHPEGLASLLNESSPITAQYTTSPFHERAIAQPGIHTVTSSKSSVFLLTAQQFRDDNPKTTQAVFEALSEAIDMLNADPRAAVETYKEMANDSTPTEELLAQLSSSNFNFSVTPAGITEITQFLHRIGTLKTPIDDWKQLFFEEVHALPGN